MTRRWPSIVVIMLRCLLAAAVGVCLALSVEGCSLAIANKERIGPNPNTEFKEGTTQADVERMLGKPVISEILSDGNVRAVYEYSARLGKSMPWYWESGKTDALKVWVLSLGTVEFVLMPWAYFAKDKHTYQMEIVYGPSGVIVEWYPERDKDHPVQGGWEGCANEADRVLPESHALEEWRTWVRRCVKGEPPDNSKETLSEGEAPNKD